MNLGIVVEVEDVVVVVVVVEVVVEDVVEVDVAVAVDGGAAGSEGGFPVFVDSNAIITAARQIAAAMNRAKSLSMVTADDNGG